MTDTLSPNLSITLMADGLHDGTWGDITNANWSIVDEAIAGSSVLTGLTGGTLNLSVAQLNAGPVIVLQGTLTSNLVVVMPASQIRQISIINETTGAFTTTVQGSGQSASIAAPILLQNTADTFYCDGTSVVGQPRDDVGTVRAYFGVELPSPRYVWANGQALSRTTYSLLLGALTRSTTVTPTSGSPTLAATEDLTTKGLIGAVVEGAGIPSGATITAISSMAITLSANATGGGAAEIIRIFPYGNGDGSTTFNVPDLSERLAMGRAGMGGAADPARVTTASISGGPANLGASGGVEQVTLSAAQMPVHTHGINDPGHAHSINDPGHSHSYQQALHGAGPSTYDFLLEYMQTSQTSVSTTGIAINGNQTGISLQTAGSGGAHANMPPVIVCNYVLKAA